MSWRVCDYITTGGGASFTISRGIQMERHLLSDEGVQVHIMKAISTATEGLGGVSRRTGRTRADRNARHGTAETWEEKTKHTSQTDMPGCLCIIPLSPRKSQPNPGCHNVPRSTHGFLQLTVQRYGLSEGLQVRFHRAARLWGRRSACRYHGDSGWGTRRPWRGDFSTQEADEVFSPDGSSAFFHPRNHLLVPALIAYLNAQIIAALAGLHALCWKDGVQGWMSSRRHAYTSRKTWSSQLLTFVHVGDGCGCILERHPQRETLLLTHSICGWYLTVNLIVTFFLFKLQMCPIETVYSGQPLKTILYTHTHTENNRSYELLLMIMSVFVYWWKIMMKTT